jgi:hypothetical protein
MTQQLFSAALPRLLEDRCGSTPWLCLRVSTFATLNTMTL